MTCIEIQQILLGMVSASLNFFCVMVFYECIIHLECKYIIDMIWDFPVLLSHSLDSRQVCIYSDLIRWIGRGLHAVGVQ